MLNRELYNWVLLLKVLLGKLGLCTKKGRSYDSRIRTVGTAKGEARSAVYISN